MSWSRLAAAAALGLALAGCGFHLRGDTAFSFASIYVNAPSSPPMSTELARSLASSNTKVLDNATNAEVVLDVPVVVDDKDVLSL